MRCYKEPALRPLTQALDGETLTRESISQRKIGVPRSRPKSSPAALTAQDMLHTGGKQPIAVNDFVAPAWPGLKCGEPPVVGILTGE